LAMSECYATCQLVSFPLLHEFQDSIDGAFNTGEG